MKLSDVFSTHFRPYVPLPFVSDDFPDQSTDSSVRLHGGKIGVCVPTEIVCKLSMLTPIKYIFYRSLLNIDYILGFCFNHIDQNKQPQHIFCDHDVAKL